MITKNIKQVNLYIIGDVHIGSKCHDRNSLVKLIEIIKKDKRAK